jgi:hypothetical protein
MSTKMLGTFRQIALLLVCAAALLASPYVAHAQQDQEAEGLCFPATGKTAVIKGFIGGEAHDSYVLHLRAGRKLSVTITSRANRAQFTVSTSEFGEQVSFGKVTNGGRTWTGTIPETGLYFISVVAHPTARYTLRVTKE